MKFPHLLALLLVLAAAPVGCQPNVSIQGDSVMQHITLDDGRVGANGPDGDTAWIHADGNLRIDGEQVALSAQQRALTLRYYAEALGLKADALAIAEAGKDMAAGAVNTVVSELLSGTPDQINGKIEAEAGKIEVSALALCRRVDQLYAAEQALVLGVPAFAAYATLEKNDNDCGSDSDGEVVALLDATKQGDVDEVRQLVDSGVDVDGRIRGDGTALIMAARQGDLEMIDLLIELGADPDQASRGDGNPLIMAAKSGHADAVKRLLAAGADVNAIVPHDETALINAARASNLEIVKLLVEHEANVNLGVKADFGRWRSPLNQASNQAVRAYLVSQGAVEKDGS